VQTSAARSRAASERRFRMASMKSDSSRLMQANEDRDVDSDVVVAFVVDRVRGDATSRNTASLLGHLRLQEHAGLTCVNVCFGTFSSTAAQMSCLWRTHEIDIRTVCKRDGSRRFTTRVLRRAS